MFRRNKNKAGGKSDDTISLTAGNAISSSSGIEEEPIAKKGGGRFGRKKKTNNNNNVHRTANAKKKQLASSGDTVPTGGSATSDRSGVEKREYNNVRQRQSEIGGMNISHVPESAPPRPQAAAARSISGNTSSKSNNNITTSKQVQGEEAHPHQLKQPIQSQSSINHGMRQRNANINSNTASMRVNASQNRSSAPVPTRQQQQPQSMNGVGGGSRSQQQNNVINNSAAVSMIRTGWSIQSNENASMNSENYIQSLDNMPALRSGKEFPTLNSQPDNRIRSALSDDRIKSALSRQFGRTYPPQTFHQKWIVEVGKPRWDDDEGRHKYKINITLNPNPGDDSVESESYSQLSFTSARTRRSLQDFVWLEQALRSEYHGALIVPILSLALYFGALSDKTITAEGGGQGGDESLASRSLATDGTSKKTVDAALETANNIPGDNAIAQSFKYIDDKMERNNFVDQTVLANWLSDIMNGMRGNGEVLLYNCVDVLSDSEAVETFLYRHSETTANNFWPSRLGGNHNQRTSSLGSPFNLFTVGKSGHHSKSLLENFWDNPFECFDTACGDEKKKRKSHNEYNSRRMQLSSMMCSSGATGVPGIENCNSFLSQSDAREGNAEWLQSSTQGGIATHSELLEAEKDLVASYLKSSALAMSRVQALAKDEVYVGKCWKRFATSLSNLFSVEKDLETAHIGDQIKINRKHQPFRKLRKSSVDDALTMLAKGKVDRSSLGLVTLSSMLNAYYGDLNSIVPAFREYAEALNQLHHLDDMNSIRSSRRRMGASSNLQSGSNEWQSSLDQLKAMFTTKVTGGESTIGTSTNGSDPTEEDYSTLGSLSSAQTKVLHTRVLQNEKMLKFSITLLCKSTPLRNARMAWWYLKTEAKEALNIHTAATTLRHKLSIDADVASAMKGRKYDEDEKKDDVAEIELVKRILDLGSSDEMNMVDRENVIRIATEQVGRWNAKTALALMEAAGVEDAEVQIDETSRELRHVRKYAISLRENVRRCLEAAETLASSFIVYSDNTVQISKSRREFWAAISAVFSGKIIFDETDSNVVNSNIGKPSTRVLASAGIDVTDRGGWLGHNAATHQPNQQQRRNCGEAARTYLKKRDNQANILISRIVKLLKDYERRLEGIESFVYMHCVGIQLEKHYSKARSKSLSAWEKRTDISTAINVATKKKIPKLVQELKVKLDALPQVSHTTVLKRKEEHLASKTLKSDMHKLANRRFGRAQEVSTERVIAVMSLWAKHEESVALEEVKALGGVIQEVELSVTSADVDAALDSRSLIRS